MPTGLQDWWLRSNINIIAQDIAELIMRPKYGKAQQHDITVDCPAGEETTLAAVEGRGVTYGGHVRVEPDVDASSDDLHIYIDGEHIIWYSFGGLLNIQAFTPSRSFVYLEAFDNIGYEYIVGISPDTTFESDFKITYENKQGADFIVYGELNYAII